MPWYQIQDLMMTAGVILIVLIPVIGFTLRFAIKPFLRDRDLMGGGQRGPALPKADERLDRMEQQLEQIEASVNRLLEVAEFDRQLKSGQPPGVDL